MSDEPIEAPVEETPAPVIPMDGAQVVDGVVTAVCPWACGGLAGIDQTGEGEFLTFEPGTVHAGMAWDGEALTWPEVAPEPAGPVRVTKPDMQRLLTAAQRSRLAKHRKIIAALPPEAYEPGSSEEPNPEYAPWLIALEDVLLAFDLPAEFIELDHPDTVAAIELFRLLDIVESDDEAARILGGEFPV